MYIKFLARAAAFKSRTTKPLGCLESTLFAVLTMAALSIYLPASMAQPSDNLGRQLDTTIIDRGGSTSTIDTGGATSTIDNGGPAPTIDTLSPGSVVDKSRAAPITLKPRIEQTVINKPFTFRGAVEYAQKAYPNVLKAESQVRAAKRNVTIQKMNEYLPESLFQYQEIMASHNKLTQVFFGSPVFPAVSGPATNDTTMKPYFFTLGGFSIDWAPIDFGLHKARIDLAKTLSAQAKTHYISTALDVELTAANAYLDAVIATEQVKAAQQNVISFEQFYSVVHAQVISSLKPGADESLALAQLANARNDLIRAQLSRDLSFANLAYAIGLGGVQVDIDARGIVERTEPADIQKNAPIFPDVPILQVSHAELLSAIAQKKVLDKEYYPVFHFLGGVNLRSSGLSATTPGGLSAHEVAGALPTIPNYQAAFIINWNFLDIFRLHQEKKVQEERIYQTQQDYNLVLQNLKTEDYQSRARVKAAVALAANMPIQVQAAVIATQQAEARYKSGLGSVAQVAQANETLAQSRVQDAIARVGVWRALLSVASVHGDLKPLLAESDKIQRGM
jgi:outer membrane protein TolC